MGSAKINKKIAGYYYVEWEFRSAKKTVKLITIFISIKNQFIH